MERHIKAQRQDTYQITRRFIGTKPSSEIIVERLLAAALDYRLMDEQDCTAV